MTGFYLAAALTLVGLSAYLAYALFYAERF